MWHSTCGYADCVEPSRYAADSICKGCRRIKYCTFACQKADWKRHKGACKAAGAADEAAAREGALVVRPRARAPPPKPGLLLEAAADGDLKHVDALLRLGADVNAADKDGFTPLYVASQFGHTAVVSALLACMQYLNSLPALVTIFYYYYGWTLGGDATRRGQASTLTRQR